MTKLPYRLLGNPEFPQEFVRLGDASNLIFFLSPEELLIIRSALDTGANIVYPDKYTSIMAWLDGVMALCAALIECIESDADTQAALQAFVQGLSGFPAQYPYGQNLPDAERSRDVASGTNPDCDLDILWAECLGVVMMTNDAIEDTFQIVEAETNVVELGNALFSAIPLVSSAKNIAGLDGALDLINYFQESVGQEYDAQYTTTPGGIQDQIACAIFCACKADCQITIDRIVSVLQDRLSVYITPPSLDGFIDLIENIAGVDVSTTFVVDLAFFVAWGMVKTANFLFGNRFDNSLDIIIKLKADEPSNDWETLCTDCPVTECVRFNSDNDAGWTFTDNGDAAPMHWRAAAAGSSMTGEKTGLSLTGYNTVDFTFDLTPAVAVGYNYIQVITDARTYNYSGPFTGTWHAIIMLDASTETIQEIRYQITSSDVLPYYIDYIDVCP